MLPGQNIKTIDRALLINVDQIDRAVSTEQYGPASPRLRQRRLPGHILEAPCQHTGPSTARLQRFCPPGCQAHPQEERRTAQRLPRLQQSSKPQLPDGRLTLSVGHTDTVSAWRSALEEWIQGGCYSYGSENDDRWQWLCQVPLRLNGAEQKSVRRSARLQGSMIRQGRECSTWQRCDQERSAA